MCVHANVSMCVCDHFTLFEAFALVHLLAQRRSKN